MAVIGSLTVDLVLKTASFISNLDKAAGNVQKNTSSMAKSLEGVRTSLDAFIGVRALKQLESFVQGSIKLASTVRGPLGIAAKDFINKVEGISNAFQIGLAQGFMDQLAKDFKITGQQIAQIGVLIGDILGKAFAQVITFITIDLPKGINDSISQLNSLIDWYNRAAEARDKAAGAPSAMAPGAGTGITGGEQGSRIASIPTMDVKPSIDAMNAYAAGLTLTDEGQKKLNADTQIFLDAVAEAEKIWKDTLTPLEAYDVAINKIAASHVNAELAARAHMQATEQLASSYISAAGQITQTLASAFTKNKAFAIANAVMNVAEGITQALKLPFPLNWAQVAAVTAAGIAQISTIQSSQPGTSAKPSAGTGGASKTASASGGGGGHGPSQSVVINLEGSGGFSRDQVRALAAELDGLVGDGMSIRTA